MHWWVDGLIGRNDEMIVLCASGRIKFKCLLTGCDYRIGQFISLCTCVMHGYIDDISL